MAASCFAKLLCLMNVRDTRSFGVGRASILDTRRGLRSNLVTAHGQATVFEGLASGKRLTVDWLRV